MPFPAVCPGRHRRGKPVLPASNVRSRFGRTIRSSNGSTRPVTATASWPGTSVGDADARRTTCRCWRGNAVPTPDAQQDRHRVTPAFPVRPTPSDRGVEHSHTDDPERPRLAPTGHPAPRTGPMNSRVRYHAASPWTATPPGTGPDDPGPRTWPSRHAIQDRRGRRGPEPMTTRRPRFPTGPCHSPKGSGGFSSF